MRRLTAWSCNLALRYVTAPIAHFTSFEVLNFIETLGRFSMFSDLRHWTFVAMVRMEPVIDVATEVGRAMEPRASANENTTGKPFRAVVAVGSTGIRRNVIVSVRADRSHSNFDGDLSIQFGCRHRECGRRHEDSGNSSERKTFESVHIFSSER